MHSGTAEDKHMRNTDKGKEAGAYSETHSFVSYSPNLCNKIENGCRNNLGLS